MKDLTLSLDQFNLKQFLQDALDQGNQFMGMPIFPVAKIAAFSFDEVFDEYENAGVEELTNGLLDGKFLFVAFSDSGANHPDVACIDGNEYRLIGEIEEEDYFDEDGAPEGFVFSNNLRLGETSNVGYLLTLSNEQLNIHTAQFHLEDFISRSSSIETIEDVEVFEKPMKEYLQQYIK